MTVERSAQQEDPAVMSVYFGTENGPQERVETINMKNYNSSEILDALVRLTKAQPVEPTPEDLEEQASLQEQAERSARDSKLSQEVRARVRREQELLEQARADVAAQNA